MSLLFDRYLAQASHPPVDTWAQKARRDADWVRKAAKKYPEHAEIQEKSAQLITDLNRHADEISRLNTQIYDYLRQAENDFLLEHGNTDVVVGDNVAKYYFDQGGSLWNDGDFFSCVPPFDLTWVEFQRPLSANYPSSYPSRWALWVQSGKLSPEVVWKEGYGAYDFCKKVGFDCPNKPQWLCRALLYIKTCKYRVGIFPQDEVSGPCRAWMLALDQSGKIERKDSSYIESSAVEGVDCDRLLQPVLLTFSLMHCKNVSVSEVPPKESHSRNWKQKTGAFLATYKVLNIEPMKKVFRDSVGNDTDAQKAMHICRGHFSDYRERGLFGKHKGVYWWDSHVRGNPERGVIGKSYRISPLLTPTPYQKGDLY